jgi:hypothetical protein
MLQIMSLTPNNQSKNKRAPFDMALMGFHFRGHRAPASGPAVQPDALANLNFTLRINNEARLDQIPVAPFFQSFYFDLPIALEANSLLEYTYTDPAAAVVVTDPPVLLLEYQPLRLVRKSGKTSMRHFRLDNNTTQTNFELYPKHYVRVRSSFCYEDNNAGGGTLPVIQFPSLVTTNEFIFKVQDSPGSNVRMIDEGQMPFWKWGQFRPTFYGTAVGATGVITAEVLRRRYFPGIMIKPDYQMVFDRILPAAGLTNYTNIIFEYEYMTKADLDVEATERAMNKAVRDAARAAATRQLSIPKK